MPVVSSKEAVIEYPLSLTDISGLEKDVLKLKRLTQRDKLEYGPKVYEPYKRFKEGEEKIRARLRDIMKDENFIPNLIRAMGREVTEEQIKELEALPQKDKENLSLFLLQGSEDNIITPQLKRLQVEIEKKAVVDLFLKLLVGWSDGFYVDEEGNNLSYSQINATKLVNDLNIEKVLLPAVIYVFEQCDMRVKLNGKVDFLSESTLSGKPEMLMLMTESK